jgi:superfamily II DNA or RNA helicase
VTFGLHQSLSGRLPGVNPDAWDIVIVDEAHHAPAETFSDCLDSLKPKFLVGMTATPFRGDGQDLGDIFGKCVSKVSLVDGMRMGFLAKVDYRLMCDNIDWDEVTSLAQSSVSIKDLNSKLFIRQRDEEIIAEIKKCCNTLDAPPRIIVFSPTCAHAAEFADLLCDRRLPAVSVSTGDKWETHKGLARFAVGDLKAVTAVDILNEGIDVPDVNVVVFLRATHSRRIFIQQLGRGLRIKPGIKEKVVILDFVTDVRRIAAVTELDREARNPAHRPGPGEIERVDLSNGVVSFSNEKAEEFINTWIEEVANLDFCDDREKMQFPKT